MLGAEECAETGRGGYYSSRRWMRAPRSSSVRVLIDCRPLAFGGSSPGSSSQNLGNERCSDVQFNEYNRDNYIP